MNIQPTLLKHEKILRDPIHDAIHIKHQVIIDLINTKEFQRLRQIKQLSTLSLIFHGAEHTRFGHCLGTYEVTRRIITNFKQNYPKERYGKDGWDSKEDIIVLCAALLHDIGHGAYSHTFEHLFNTNHEQFTVDIILSNQTEVNQVLRKCHPNLPEIVASVIQKKYPNKQVVQLISSQADADRMDYLLRDAYYTGANYGIYDLARILEVIRPYKNGICFKANGSHAVEDYITSRYQMFTQLYFHPVSRGMEVILTNIFKRAQDLYPHSKNYFQQTSPWLVPFFEQNFDLEDYLKLNDSVLHTYFSQWLNCKDNILRDLCQKFLYRKPFKSIKIPTDTDLRQLKIMRSLLTKLGYDYNYYAALNSASDVPYDIYRAYKHHAQTQIELIEEDGTLEELSTKSPLVKALSGEKIIDRRFYVPKELVTGNDNNLNPELLAKFRSYIHNNTFTFSKETTLYDN